jgi:hypothetical protein
MFAPFLQKHAVKSPTLLRAVSSALCSKEGILRILILLAIVAVTSSCMVLPESYYFPESSSGETSKAYCHGSTGPQEVLKIEYGGIVLNIRVDEQDDILEMRITLYVPEGQSISWVNQQVIAKVNDSKTAIGNIKYIEQLNYVNGAFNNEIIPLGQSMEFKDKPYQQKSIYLGIVQFDELDVSSLNIKNLSFKVNGTTKVIEVLNFTKKSGVYIYPLNC